MNIHSKFLKYLTRFFFLIVRLQEEVFVPNKTLTDTLDKWLVLGEEIGRRPRGFLWLLLYMRIYESLPHVRDSKKDHLHHALALKPLNVPQIGNACTVIGVPVVAYCIKWLSMCRCMLIHESDCVYLCPLWRSKSTHHCVYVCLCNKHAFIYFWNSSWFALWHFSTG